MASRRNARNAIRGPQSALTDFLAANNISAVQIRNTQNQRRQAAEAAATAADADGDDNNFSAQDGSETDDAQDEVIAKPTTGKRARASMLKKSKALKKGVKDHRARSDDDDADNDDQDWDMYEKAKPMPGQLENCEICDKRFTVTPYSKSGPEGGLLCTKCGKEIDLQKKKEAKANKPPIVRAKRRKMQSNLMDDVVTKGAKSLQELCVEKVADNIHDVEEFGALPPRLLDRLSQILSKRRVMNSRTLQLFLQEPSDAIAIYDCAKFETDDFLQMFISMPDLKNLNLRNVGQMKDEIFDYIIKNHRFLEHLRLECPNLISDEKWAEFFNVSGIKLQTLKLYWLDSSFDDDTMAHVAAGCPQLRRLKIKRCFRVTERSLPYIAQFKMLEHLSLMFSGATSNERLVELVHEAGSNLKTLSLESFQDADDGLLETIHSHCTKLTKLRLTNNDICTDKAFAALFTDWNGPPLRMADFTEMRSIDYENPDGNENDPVGFGSKSLVALMVHSGARLERLHITSCRHISNSSFYDVFNDSKIYPKLQEINVSFIPQVDELVLAGMFRSCPALKKVIAFACFDLRDVIVPAGRDITVIGVPNAQESIMKGDSALPWLLKQYNGA